jgi:hypothetical protein
MKGKMIRMLTMHVVFEKLEAYYDGNDSVFVIAFDNKEDADDYVKNNPQHSYYVDTRNLYAVGKGVDNNGKNQTV